jgi:hypothetical protein
VTRPVIEVRAYAVVQQVSDDLRSTRRSAADAAAMGDYPKAARFFAGCAAACEALAKGDHVAALRALYDAHDFTLEVLP